MFALVKLNDSLDWFDLSSSNLTAVQANATSKHSMLRRRKHRSWRHTTQQDTKLYTAQLNPNRAATASRAARLRLKALRAHKAFWLSLMGYVCHTSYIRMCLYQRQHTGRNILLLQDMSYQHTLSTS